jgi:hypothetical protein
MFRRDPPLPSYKLRIYRFDSHRYHNINTILGHYPQVVFNLNSKMIVAVSPRVFGINMLGSVQEEVCNTLT